MWKDGEIMHTNYPNAPRQRKLEYVCDCVDESCCDLFACVRQSAPFGGDDRTEGAAY